MKTKQLKDNTRVFALEDGIFFIPIPDAFIQKLGLKEGDIVDINETKICDGHREVVGFTISKVEDESK